MKKFIVKCLNAADVTYVLSLAFERGWKWFDDSNAIQPGGQTIKNTHAKYLYFGSKGEGLISWANTVRNGFTPSDVINARTNTADVIKSLSENSILYAGKDEIVVTDDGVKCGCKKFPDDIIMEILDVSRRVSGLTERVTFHPDGSVTVCDRHISAGLLQEIADRVT